MNPQANKQLSFLDFLSLSFSACIFALIYLFFVNSLDNFTSWLRVEKIPGVEFILVDAVSIVPAIWLSLLFVKKRLKMLAGTFFISLLFLAILYFDIFRNTQELLELTESMMRLCVTAIGAFLGLYIAMSSSSDDMNIRHDTEEILVDPSASHKISLFLFLFSILSFPMVYLSFIIFILSPLCFALWLLLLAQNSPDMPQLIWIFIILIQTICILITTQTIHTTFVLDPPIQPGLVINLETNPRLKQIINEICIVLRIPAPETLILHAEPKVIVRKSNLNTFNGLIKQRVLAVGLPLLYSLNLKEFKALITYELAPFSGRDKLYSELILPSYQIFSDSFAQMDNVLLKLQRGKTQQGIVGFTQFPYKFFLQIISEQFAQLDNFLTPARKRRAMLITQKHYESECIQSALSKKEHVHKYFQDTFNQMPFSESNIFRQFHEMLKDQFKETLDMSQDEVMKEIVLELEPLEPKISLIYQYFRHIKRYYKEFYRLLKEFKTDNIQGDSLTAGPLSLGK